MFKKMFPVAIASVVFILPLQSQTDFEYAISGHKGNKILLLGTPNAEETGKWKQIIDSDGVYGHRFSIVDRGNLASPYTFTALPKFIDGFENWFRQRYGLSGRAKWAALDLENNLLVFGIQTPSAKEFEHMLDQRGIKSPLRKVRDFLRENPDHIDAMTDLLMEVRRRALHVMPQNITEDLDTEADLRTWAPLAAETDRVFNGNWLGIDIIFFRPDQPPPERFSKLMKASFSKHISKVESAIRLEPTNKTLWNIWAWMARSLPDYKWSNLINSIDTFDFPSINLNLSSPSDEICVWLVEEAMAKGDWETVIKYAKIARSYRGIYIPSANKAEWVPGRSSVVIWDPANFTQISGYPGISAYLPHLEALLRLGRIEEANKLYDELIRKDFIGFGSSTAAAHAARVAKSLGMDEIAAIYGQGKLISNAPWFLLNSLNYDGLGFFVYTYFNSRYYNRFNGLTKELTPMMTFQYAHDYGKDIDSLGWKKDGGFRWALIASDGRVMAQDSLIPTLDEMQALCSKLGIENGTELAKKYLATHNGPPGLEMHLAFNIVFENNRVLESDRYIRGLDDSQSEVFWGDVARYLRRVLAGNPEILVNLPFEVFPYDASKESQQLRAISRSMLINIEPLLERKPSSNALWRQWLFWNAIDDSERSIEPLLERIKLSPITQVGTVPPAFVIDEYYKDCKKSGSWNKVVRLLKTAWEREISRIDAEVSQREAFFVGINKYNLGDWLGIHLIEAYLQDGRPGDANEIFNAVLGIGGKFTDISKILDLAKEKGQERLAREWEEKVKK